MLFCECRRSVLDRGHAGFSKLNAGHRGRDPNESREGLKRLLLKACDVLKSKENDGSHARFDFGFG